MPNALPISWRLFLLVAALAAALTGLTWLSSRALAGDPDRTNAVLRDCVDAERVAGRSGRACIGRVTEPCKREPGNAHRQDQMECDEREFVLWSQLVHKELAALAALLDAAQRAKLRQAQDRWIAYQSADCRLPYALFATDRAERIGPACTIALKAARALQLRAWREALGGSPRAHLGR